jgi:hypothetical protein
MTHDKTAIKMAESLLAPVDLAIESTTTYHLAFPPMLLAHVKLRTIYTWSVHTAELP